MKGLTDKNGFERLVLVSDFVIFHVFALLTKNLAFF